jgi:hypothetical protein
MSSIGLVSCADAIFGTHKLSKLEPRESMEQGGKERPIRRGEAGFVYLTLQDVESDVPHFSKLIWLPTVRRVGARSGCRAREEPYGLV